MGFSVDDIKQLREETSCGVIDCKNALEQSGGDIDKAKEILRERGLQIAAKKSSRSVKEGRVETYIHMGNKIGVLVEVNCETDFVARSEDFVCFCKDIAMHIAAMDPRYIAEADIPEACLSEQADPDAFMKERCLLAQPFVKDPSMTIQDCLTALIAKMGENIIVRRFIRFQVGRDES